MRLSFKIKHYFLSAFRELFVHHHGSLNFRAKVFALVIAANEKAKVENYIIVKDIALKIYDGDNDRATFLMNSTKELVDKVKENNGFNIDSLVQNIQNELKIVPRYAKKIDVDALRPLLQLTRDEDTRTYQESILEFLQTTKDEILQTHFN